MKGKSLTSPKHSSWLMLPLALLFFGPFGQLVFPREAMAYNAPASFADLAEQVKHSVANISTTQVVKGSAMTPFTGRNDQFRDFFGDDFFKHFFGEVPQGDVKTHALGSGFVVDRRGLILTNNHVVEKAAEIKVKFDTGKEYTAKVLGRDPKPLYRISLKVYGLGSHVIVFALAFDRARRKPTEPNNSSSC